MELVQKVKTVIERLSKLYPEPKLELRFSTPFELLVMAILAAQDSDKKVNETARELFVEFKTPEDFARRDPLEVAEKIKHIRWNRQKAKHLVLCCRELIRLHDGKVPDDVDKLSALPGVGRKTAHMVVGGAFGKPALITDRHFIRVANRLGLTSQTKPEKVEKELSKKIPPEYWLPLSLLLIEHGKKVCRPRPKCEMCPLTDICDCYIETGCGDERKTKRDDKKDKVGRG